MSLKTLLKDLSKLSEEEKALLASVLAPKQTVAKESTREHVPPAAARAETVYFFRQLERYGSTSIKNVNGKMVKEATALPPRVIFVNEAQASKLFWKSRGKYEFLGRGDGKTWQKARESGKSVAEAMDLEYKATIEAGNMEPPRNNEKTFFQGKSIASASRGVEMDWKDGFKQIR